MQIIDAQIHLWAAGLPRNPTHWAVTNFTAEEAIAPMDEGGINAAVEFIRLTGIRAQWNWHSRRCGITGNRYFRDAMLLASVRDDGSCSLINPGPHEYFRAERRPACVCGDTRPPVHRGQDRSARRRSGGWWLRA